MKSPDNLESRFDRLRTEWPVESMVDGVMNRIHSTGILPKPRRRRKRVLAGMAMSVTLMALALDWFVFFSHPDSLLASVQHDLKRAESAHVVITQWDKTEASQKAEIWYVKGKGLRATFGDEVIVEDGATQWSWSSKKDDGEKMVLQQSSPGFFTTQLPGMLAIPEESRQFKKTRDSDRDRVINGKELQGFSLTLDETKGMARAPGQPVTRALVLAERAGRIHEITLQDQLKDGTWKTTRKIEIDYEALGAAEKVAVRLPDGARVLDRAKVFDETYPLEKAISQVELGGLLFAVHDIQPLKDREGVYVVSSVRGTKEFLIEYPPKVRALNPEVVLLDVAFQPGSNMTQGSKYHRIVLGSATRAGVEYSWWLVLPRRHYRLKDGKRVYETETNDWAPPGEPARLDDVAGKARVPLSATYWDEKHRDAKGTQQGVSTWASVPLPTNRPPTTLEEVAGRARSDIRLMSASGAGGMLGVAGDLKPEPMKLRPLSRISPETTAADFAEAVRRGLEDLRQFDLVEDAPGGVMVPGAKGK